METTETHTQEDLIDNTRAEDLPMERTQTDSAPDDSDRDGFTPDFSRTDSSIDSGHLAWAQALLGDGSAQPQFATVNDPMTGRKLPSEGHAQDTEPVEKENWEAFETVNDPLTDRKLPNEGHAQDPDPEEKGTWEAFETVNDPLTDRKLPNEGHAAGADPEGVSLEVNGPDDQAPWDEIIEMASHRVDENQARGREEREGKNEDPIEDDHDDVPTDWDTPNEGHIAGAENGLGPILVTVSFCDDIREIYGRFAPGDDEYPSLGITVQGAPIFVECTPFPDCAVTRAQERDSVDRDHPEARALWQEKLEEYAGKCRSSTVHIHPMNLPTLSAIDIQNFDRLRSNPDDPSTFDGRHPYPVVLVNLLGPQDLELRGFWVTDGEACEVPVKTIPNDSELVERAWQNSREEAYYSREGCLTRRVDEATGKEWSVEFVKNQSGQKAMKIQHLDGRRCILGFSPSQPLGFSVCGDESVSFQLTEYVDWDRALNDLLEGTA